jgi:hypothetical protein
MNAKPEQATMAAGDPPAVDDPAFLTALVTEHFVLQTARSIGTGEATSRAGLYVATLSSGLVATGFASGKPYFAVFLGAVLIVVLALGLVTFARLVEISREDLARLRDLRIVHRYYGTLSPGAGRYFKDVDTDDISAVIETQYKRHSPFLIRTSAASLVAILNSVVLGTGLTGLASATSGGFRGWDVAVGVAGAVLSCWLALWFESRELNAPAR